jgi:hypothetical protein
LFHHSYGAPAGLGQHPVGAPTEVEETLLPTETENKTLSLIETKKHLSRAMIVVVSTVKKSLSVVGKAELKSLWKG